jgi:phosphoglucosamine mutase
VISASHNPFPDNGIKFFAPGGAKLDDALEARLEAELDRFIAGGHEAVVPTGDGVGRSAAVPAGDRYGDALVATLEGRRLDGIRVVLDCAHGAAFEVAPRAVALAGATVEVIGDRPDGCNINDGVGSTHPQALQREVVARGADAGLAFDGDADRVLAVDGKGNLVDGDQIIAMCALDRRGRGLLPDDTVVVTVMANLGFRHAMADAGIKLVEVGVGDRHVLAALESGGWALGGEQSGHVIFRDLATTGDGILTGLHVLDVMARSGRPLHELAAVMDRHPQVLRNVTLPRRGLDVETAIADDVAAAERDLGEDGRVLIRASGTEPVVRVMVEAGTLDQAEAVAARLAAAVERTLGG